MKGLAEFFITNGFWGWVGGVIYLSIIALVAFYILDYITNFFRRS